MLLPRTLVLPLLLSCPPPRSAPQCSELGPPQRPQGMPRMTQPTAGGGEAPIAPGYDADVRHAEWPFCSSPPSLSNLPGTRPSLSIRH